MPFKKTGKDMYKSPSGRKFTKKQVALYYAQGGKFPSNNAKKKKDKTNDKKAK